MYFFNQSQCSWAVVSSRGRVYSALKKKVLKGRRIPTERVSQWEGYVHRQHISDWHLWELWPYITLMLPFRGKTKVSSKDRNCIWTSIWQNNLTHLFSQCIKLCQVKATLTAIEHLHYCEKLFLIYLLACLPLQPFPTTTYFLTWAFNITRMDLASTQCQ